MKIQVAVGLTSLLFVISSYAFAHICWIDRVEQVSDGLNLYFRERAALRANVKSAGENTKIDRYTVTNRIVKGNELELDHLFLKQGDTVFLMQLIEDTCTLTVENRGKRLGIRAKSIMRLPGLPQEDTTEFIEAQGVPTEK